MDRELCSLLKTITDDMRRKLDNDFRDYDLSFSQGRALYFIELKSGEMTQKSLEECLGISHAATHGLLDRLSQKGFIKLHTSEEDKRHVVITITPLGKERLHTMEARKNAIDPLRVLTEEETEQLKRLLRKMADSI